MITSVTEPSNPARHFSVILGCDIVKREHGSSVPESYYREVLAARIALHRGSVFRTSGSLVLVEFEDPADGVNCAISLHEQFARYNRLHPGEETIDAKIGIHYGELLFVDGTYAGKGIDVAAALPSIVPPFKLYLTRDVIPRVRMLLVLKYESVGKKTLASAEPTEVLSVAWEAVTENLEASLKRLDADDLQRATAISSKLGVKASKRASPIVMFLFLLFLFVLFKILKWI